MMKKRISFQISHLKSLLDSENSSVTVVKNFKGKLSLLPFHLGYLKHAVKDLLDNKVSKYDPELNGIILGHSNIKVINFLQHSDSGSINLDYVADIYLFTPSVGQTLTGVINKKSKEHIGCLIHSAFNATIPKPRTVGEELSSWLRSNGSAQIGNELDFTVTKVDFTSRVPYISGVIVRKDSDSTGEDVDSGVCCQDSIDEDTVKSKKKKRKFKTEQFNDINNPENEFTNYHDPAQIAELFGSDNPIKHVSGKRKKSSGVDPLNESASSAPPVKKVKKEKLSLDTDIDCQVAKESCSRDSSLLPVPLDRIKRERTSLSPQEIKSPSSPKKSKKKSLDRCEMANFKKVKSEPSLDELTSSLLSEALEDCRSPKHSGSPIPSDINKKKKKDKKHKAKLSLEEHSASHSTSLKLNPSLDESQIASPKNAKKRHKSIEGTEIMSPEINKVEKKSRKRKRSNSPAKSENDESFVKPSKKKKSKISSDLDELTNSLLAETMSKLK